MCLPGLLHENQNSFESKTSEGNWQKNSLLRLSQERSTLLTALPPKKQLLYEKSNSNKPRTKLPTVVKIAISSRIKRLLLIYRSNINYLV